LLEIDRDEFGYLPKQLEGLMEQVSGLAQADDRDPIKLLQILRSLEQTHRQICEDLFMPALPTARHSLFNLLLEIEANGGWPHIYRISLQNLCQNLKEDLAEPTPIEESLDSETADSQVFE
jgi:hypothetical protein